MAGIEELVYAVCLWHKREDVFSIILEHIFPLKVMTKTAME